MITKQFFAGIDISAKKLDFCLIKTPEGKSSRLLALTVENSFEGVTKIFSSISARGISPKECFFCAEHTGNYGLLLCSALEEAGLSYSMVSSLEIKRSLGITRGKNDQVDAYRIASYGYTFKHKITESKMPSSLLQTIKGYLTYRALLVKQRTQLINSLKSHKKASLLTNNDFIIQDHQNKIKEISESVKSIETSINQCLMSNEELKKSFAMATSVKGIGLITAAFIITYTSNFTAFLNARKFSCYSGLAPFEKSSGQYKGRTQVSTLANKQLKSLLLNAANSAIEHDQEQRNYYLRKTKEGKDKRLVKNAVANKLIARVFASVKRGTPYVITYQQKIA